MFLIREDGGCGVNAECAPGITFVCGTGVEVGRLMLRRLICDECARSDDEAVYAGTPYRAAHDPRHRTHSVECLLCGWWLGLLSDSALALLKFDQHLHERHRPLF